VPAYCRGVQDASQAVVVTDLKLRYGSVVAIDDVSFGVDFGSVTALLGPNGAGKTSLIEACEGIRRPTSGSIRVDGRDPLTERHLLDPPVGAMLQSGGIYPAARVEETVADYCALYDQGAQADELIDMVGLSHRERATWRSLSGGERQRLALALALSARPKIAFLDEPTSGVDLEGRDAIANIVTGLAAGGCAVVISTHDVSEVDSYADRVIVMKDGKIAADRSLRDSTTDNVEFRFRTEPRIDASQLSRELGVPIELADGEFVGFGASIVVSSLGHAVTSQGSELRDLRVTSGIQALYRQIVRGNAT
jgi:ABC-2 type transport system ATP-binding protein